jgi:hypothetical protein
MKASARDAELVVQFIKKLALYEKLEDKAESKVKICASNLLHFLAQGLAA